MQRVRVRPARRLGAALVAAVVAGGLTACTGPDRPGPEDEAEDLARALTFGDFSEVSFQADVAPDGPAATREEALAGLSPFTSQVVVDDVVVDEEDEDRAVATLATTWDLGTAEPWTYSVRADLARGGDDSDPDAWQVRWTPALLAPDLREREILVTDRVRAARGRVLGAGGAVIVEDRPVHRIGIDKTLGEPDQQAVDARALAAALEMDPDAYAARVAAAGPKAFVEAIVVREADPAYDVEALTATPTSRAVPGSLPLAPTRTFARAVLGTAGEATAEIVEASDGAVVAGDMAGLSGLQQRYDALLRGTPGLTIRAVIPDDEGDRQLYTSAAVAGADLQLTLDVDLQLHAEAVLVDVAPAAAIVALQPSTGDVLALASGPGSAGSSTASLGQYPPGSVFKVASALALLRAGATQETIVSCPEQVVVDGRPFQNFPGYPTGALGEVPLRTAFAHSCNTAFIGARDQVDPTALAGAAGSLGLTGQPDLGFPAFLGEVPTDATGTDHAASLIGQGRVLTSPLGMATVAASVAAGQRVTPRLVLADEAGGGSAESVEVTPLTAAEATALRALMRAVVTEGGAAFLASVPGAEVAAKTGTAQFGTGEDLQNHAWMIAVQGDLAVAVFVEVGDYGSTTAGPLLDTFLRGAGD